jgi:sulfur carrier protein|uniref:Thiamine biosynthesis protein n=1 Tax=Paralia sulcata TaxID=216927 RepID=UPI0022F2AC74|nr:Thiamine biosynthesis protein [Paralia sulcata]WAJ57816.1 Thiamine biosynthesis protein [Paralia sulcata]
MTKIQTFSLNGQNYSSQNRFTIFDLLKYFDYNLSLLVIEYNNYICPKNNWKKIYINSNDKIEIVTIVGGG